MESKRQRDTFIFYRSFKESMSDLSDADKLIMYEADAIDEAVKKQVVFKYRRA